MYPPERVPAALNNFFRVENLATLREVALRQVAEDVEAKRARAAGERSARARSGSPTRPPQAVGRARCWRW